MAYTDKMVATLRENAPLNLEKAKDIAGDLGVSYRSVIAKAKQEGIEYETKAPARKAKAKTKAEMVQELSEMTGQDLEGLDKAPVTVIETLTELLK